MTLPIVGMGRSLDRELVFDVVFRGLSRLAGLDGWQMSCIPREASTRSERIFFSVGNSYLEAISWCVVFLFYLCGVLGHRGSELGLDLCHRDILDSGAQL